MTEQEKFTREMEEFCSRKNAMRPMINWLATPEEIKEMQKRADEMREELSFFKHLFIVGVVGIIVFVLSLLLS